ncbi:MAG: Holliday junction branch migration protein RuvA [Calditrichaceae bacterium]|nr:Holliday junction branch migration protein RuvA [Calditrichaceae bacterium]
MLEYIRGRLVTKQPMLAVVDVNGLGYALKISLSTYQKLPEQDSEVELKTYLHVREDVFQFYGFFDDTERDLFTGLLGISGIGPKLAQTVLSGMSAEKLVKAIQTGDEATLSSISGIGKKTAQRLIVELKDKLKSIRFELGGEEEDSKQTLGVSGEEVMMALLSLGYGRAQAERAIRKVQQNGHSLTVEEMIKQALQAI